VNVVPGSLRTLFVAFILAVIAIAILHGSCDDDQPRALPAASTPTPRQQ
jgi:hypothetical protein